MLWCHFRTIFFHDHLITSSYMFKKQIICFLNQTFKLASIWTQLSEFPLMVLLNDKKYHFQNIDLFHAHGNSCCDAVSYFWLSENEQHRSIPNLSKLLRNSLFSICIQSSFILPHDTLYVIRVCYWSMIGILFGI